MRYFDIPAQQWQKYADAYSAHIAVEHKGKGPVAVRTVEHDGFLYTSFSVHHGPYSDKSRPTVNGWRLVPVELYKGETTVKYHDEDEIREGRRDRGDMTGVILSVRGKHMVCAERASFAMALPTSKPVDLSAAQKANAEHTNGWRVSLYGNATVSWHSLKGHPVVRYTKPDDGSLSVLFWAKGKQIEEMTIHGSVELDPCIQDQPKPVVKVKKAEEQLCLMF